MKVLVVTSQIHQIGGYERLSVELAVGLNEAGVHAGLLSIYKRDLDGVAAAARNVSAAGVPLIHYLDLPFKPSPINLLLAIFRFRGILRRHNYDAIEVSGFTPSLIAALGTFGKGMKVILGIHMQHSSDRNGGLRYAVWKQILRFRKGLQFYAISNAVAADWIAFSSTSPQRTTVVYNSINDDHYALRGELGTGTAVRNELGVSHQDKLILFVGRLTQSKGIHTLFEAAEPLLSARPHCHLVVVGREDDSESVEDAICLREIKSTVQSADWGGRVYFLGERLDVPAVMAACDLLVHPPKHEGFGLVLAEALAAGLPIVASDVGGIPEVLANTDSILIPPDDAKSLTQAVVSLLDTPPNVIKAIRRKGQARAEAFSLARRVRDIAGLLG